MLLIGRTPLLFIGRKPGNFQMYRNAVILQLRELWFKNLKKSMMKSQELEFLGMVINLKEMTISLPEEKLQKVKLQCLNFYQNPQISILELTKLFGHLTQTIQAVLPAPLNRRFLQ